LIAGAAAGSGGLCLYGPFFVRRFPGFYLGRPMSGSLDAAQAKPWKTTPKNLEYTLMHRDLEEILISTPRLNAGIKKLGRRISSDYAGRSVTLVGVLKGCVLFMADLVRHISVETRLDFMMLSSYCGTQSTGVVRTVLDLKENIEGRDVLVVEDIVDSGLTMSYMLRNLKTRRPKSLEICTLLDKPSCRKANVSIKYTGFTIPNKFVVGYGLDYNEIYRNLPYIGVLKKEVIEGTKLCR